MHPTGLALPVSPELLHLNGTPVDLGWQVATSLPIWTGRAAVTGADSKARSGERGGGGGARESDGWNKGDRNEKGN